MLALIPVSGSTAPTTGQRNRDALDGATRSDDLDALPSRFLGGLGGENGDDGHTVYSDLHLGAQLIADTAFRGHQCGVDDTFGLAGAGGAPRPGAIVATAGEFYVDATCHAAAQATTCWRQWETQARLEGEHDGMNRWSGPLSWLFSSGDTTAGYGDDCRPTASCCDGSGSVLSIAYEAVPAPNRPPFRRCPGIGL